MNSAPLILNWNHKDQGIAEILELSDLGIMELEELGNQGKHTTLAIQSKQAKLLTVQSLLSHLMAKLT